jgi:hypothetical protein
MEHFSEITPMGGPGDGGTGPAGPAGPTGPTGAAGKSAYQLAVEAGFTGTLDEWLASLEGADGDDGTNGEDGEDGKSAYEVAVENGFVGTEEEWLESLRAMQFGSEIVPSPVGGSGESAEHVPIYGSEILPAPIPTEGETTVWHITYHVITANDVTNKYFDIDEEIADDLKDNTVLTVETDVQSRDDYEVIAPSRISWDGKGLETDPPMQAGWRTWVFYPVKVAVVGGGAPSTPGESDKRYTHTQYAPSETWNVQHNLGEKPTVVVVRDSVGDEIICYHDWAASTMNLLVLRFSEPLTGTVLVMA